MPSDGRSRSYPRAELHHGAQVSQLRSRAMTVMSESGASSGRKASKMLWSIKRHEGLPTRSWIDGKDCRIS